MEMIIWRYPKKKEKKRGKKYRYEDMKQLEKRKIVENERTDS